MFCYCVFFSLFFFFNDPATTEIYTLSLHDALPISSSADSDGVVGVRPARRSRPRGDPEVRPLRHLPAPVSKDRKSTRLNSSHVAISYAVFCLKKKKQKKKHKQQCIHTDCTY